MEYKHNKDIFISYKNDGIGNNFAARLAQDLRDCGYSVYFNPDEEKCDDFPIRLKCAIESCKDFLCIVTPAYLTDLLYEEEMTWVRKEVLCAKEANKKIRPILINGTKMPGTANEIHNDLSFFIKIDAIALPEQYIISPFKIMCDDLLSNPDGKDLLRDLYHSNPDFDPDDTLKDILCEAEKGIIEAMYQAGVYYFYGIATKQNYKEAAKWFLKVADSESEFTSSACKFIGRMYYQGCMPRQAQSYKRSFYYHTMAAQTDAFSARHVACMMARGSGCDFDYKATEEYFLSIIDRCDDIAKLPLGELYCKHGKFRKAAQLYEQIYETNPAAAYELGLMYKNGVLTEPPSPDYSKASLYLKSAAENGHVRAAYELGDLFFNPTGSFKCDFGKAQRYFKFAADKGDENAQYVLGYMYEFGHVKRDLNQSIKYYEMSFAQKNIFAAAHLAILYQQPEVHNYERAFWCSKFAADAGDAPSEFVLGTLYLSGRGCEPDVDKAYLHLVHASVHGAPEALILLKQMQAKGL